MSQYLGYEFSKFTTIIGLLGSMELCSYKEIKSLQIFNIMWKSFNTRALSWENLSFGFAGVFFTLLC